MTTTCRHGRTPPCVYCVTRISPHDFYEMMRCLVSPPTTRALACWPRGA